MPESGLTPADGDLVRPFVLERPQLRGRLVRLDRSLDAILSRHDYPPPVAKLLGEMLVMTALLASLLKYDGVFTLQIKGDGPVSLLVADLTSEGALRGYAQFKAEDFAAGNSKAGETPNARQLVGDGYLAFTVDQGEESGRYQGIVEITGEETRDFVQHYFRQSEQLPTGLMLGVRHLDGEAGWQAGGLLLQQTPEETPSEENPRPGPLSSIEEDDWRRALILMSTAQVAELADAALPADDLLYRLFHEEEVRVFPRRPLEDRCRCSRERIERVFASLPPDERRDLKGEDGKVAVTCQFCNRHYSFDEIEMAAIDAAAERGGA